MAKKKRRHTGVTYLGEIDGVRWYRIRTQTTNPKTGRTHEIDRRVTAESASDAATILASERAEWLRKRTRAEDDARRRLGDALTAWLAEKRPTIKPSTASTYGSAVAWWGALLGDYWLDAVDPADVRDALLGAREGGDATDTINGRLRVLRTFAREERCSAIVDGVRALERTIGEDEASEDEGRGLSLEELRRFLDAGPTVELDRFGRITKPWQRAWALVATLAWTGMRFGEASALRWSDVDLSARTIRVRRAVWRGIVGHVKARASKRLVVIPDELADVLREHRRALVAHQQIGASSSLVFPSRRSGSRTGHVTNGYAGKAILRTCKAAGVDLGDRPWVHVLRHTANNLIRQSTSELVRQALIGHADEEIGARYSAVTMDERRRAVGEVVRMVRGEKV